MPRFVIALIAALVCCLCSPAAFAGAKRKPDVLLVHAISPDPARVNDVVNKLSATGLFGTVAAFDAAAATPTLTQLNEYDAVMVTNGFPWSNAAALGTVLQQYVDAGGGVVQTIFTTAGSPGSNLGGTWTAAYNCIAFGPSINGTNATLGTIADQIHPIMIGVQSFNGGTSSIRPSGTALTPGATLVASWSDGKPLVAVGPKVNRCDLGMFPVSADAFSSGWLPSTDGVKLMANALLYVIRPKVLLVAADVQVYSADVQLKLRATGTLGQVDVFNARVDTPTLAQLQKYDAVLVWSNDPFNNSTALGNVLADYVDAGGGVVSALFATGYSPDSLRLGGRWISGDYEIVPALSSFSVGQATLGAVAYPSHPIMNGVASFNGGNTSLRPTLTSVNPGGLIVAQWSDGKTLVAVSTKMHNRVDLGMFPPSSDAFAGFWTPSTDGGKLMANALLYTVKPYIACVAADPAMDDAVFKLTASRRFSGVARIDANAAVPALTTLSPFHAVATWTNSAYANPTAYGNTLADYVDAGGGVVTALFGNTSFSSPQGRWITEGYEITPSPLPGFITSVGQQSLGQVLEPTHPIASFVRRFDGGFNSPRQNATPLLRGRTVMKWTDGKMLTSVHNSKKRADLGYYPVSSAGNGVLWDERTDGTWLTANALEFVVRVKPCPGDLNGDGTVDDNDFQLFVGPYDTLLDPRADFTGDANTDDADFQVFVQAYNELLCP
jgi:hypothetical protein